ncbi:hypothetical protein [Synechococcus sp. BA-132 BA5]|uniref:hypothetical protein n=1 Tax=Synechococcus sp. BA-132 BA5 TaxID=3110252 RepID=UPI002B1FEA2B|nr:hypothetical protein [Synechococcus sp. BA-132 BA5]MEA5416915.1 hypothetical protein [Synechococcus sp. BA-132 BA5]
MGFKLAARPSAPFNRIDQALRLVGEKVGSNTTIVPYLFLGTDAGFKAAMEARGVDVICSFALPATSQPRNRPAAANP